MSKFTFLDRATLEKIGLSSEDIETFIETRVRIGRINTPQDIDNVGAELTPSGQQKWKDFVNAASSDDAVSPSRRQLNLVDLTLKPSLPMLSEKDYFVNFSFHRQIEKELFFIKEPFSMRGPNRYTLYDLSFDHLIHIQIHDENETVIYERVLTPIPHIEEGSVTRIVWHATPPIGNGERIMREGDAAIFVTLLLDTQVKPDAGTTVTVPNTRFERQGRFQVVGTPRFRFDGYGMSVGLVTETTLLHLKGVLDTADGTVAAILQVDKQDNTQLLDLLTRIPLRVAEFDFDGRFKVGDSYKSFDEVVGWIWVLSGPNLFAGFQPDKSPEVPVHDILILLNGNFTSSWAEDTPLNVSEAGLLNRPDIFADDPGTSCKPFNNPGRILGEKRFKTVLRVTQPKVDKAGSSPIRFENQKTRTVDFPRFGVDSKNMIDYEADDPALYQAQTVAIGHVLEHAVRYRSNGYSLGDIAYSLTLAPRQKRRIMKLDYARRERNRRDESTISDDEVMDTLDRERDYDNAVASELSEWSRGRSSASSTAAAFGMGGFFGSTVFGGGIATGRSQTNASQSGGRKAAAHESQNLRDAIRRFGQSVRSLESTVVTEIEQTESIEGVSEVVQNINYTRSLSVIYYEILRHLRVDTEIASVTECVFVPMRIKPFDDKRISRHRRVLARYAKGWLERSVFRYLDDIQAYLKKKDSKNSDDKSNDSVIPDGIQAEQTLTELSGSLWLNIGINMPTEGPEFKEINEKTDQEVYRRERRRLLEVTFRLFAPLLPAPTSVLVRRIEQASDAERERYFQNEIAPHMARSYLDKLKLFKLQGSEEKDLTADFTLASAYRYGRTVRVDFTVTLDEKDKTTDEEAQLTRNDLKYLKLKSDSTTDLPPRSYLNLTSAQINYATDYYRSSARSDRGTRDLLKSETGAPDPNGATMTFRLNSRDQLNLRNRLAQGYLELKKTLKDNTFRYHKAIWSHMDRDELYTLLDGFAISDEDGRSLASMVERQPIGIVGNSLVFAVKTDVPLDPMFDTFESLKNHYVAGLPPADPMRISLPTDGLYARAHMDDCVAAEEHDGSFDWVFNNVEPELADFPSNMFDSRRAEPQGLEPTKFPDNIISLQNAPAAPPVSGLSDALSAVQNSNSFRDITGIEGTQANLRAAMEGATNLATNFGNMALQARMAEMEADAKAGKALKSFSAANKKAVEEGTMSQEKAQNNTESFAKRKAQGAKKAREESVAKTNQKIMDGEGGGTQVNVTEDGAQVVHKEPRKPRKPDPVAKISVVPIPPNQILFMNFATGRSDLRSDHVHALEILAGKIGLELEDVIKIEGHASRSGSEDSNETLGRERAEALFEKFHALVKPMNPEPNFSPDYVDSTGERGSYRKQFSGVSAIADAPGEGHPNDPVEKAVLFTFQAGTSVDVTPTEVVDFFGVKITVAGNFVFMGNKIIANTRQNNIKIIDRSSNDTNITLNKNVENHNISVDGGEFNLKVVEGDLIIQTNHGDEGAFIKIICDNNGQYESVTQGPSPHDEWKLLFTGPRIEGATNVKLSDIVKSLVDKINDLSPFPNPTTLLKKISSYAIVDQAIEYLIDDVLHLDSLGEVYFGTIAFHAHVKAKVNPDEMAVGTFSAPGMLIGEQKEVPSAVILNNADYKTSLPLKVNDWFNQKSFSEFMYTDNAYMDNIITLSAGIGELVELMPFVGDELSEMYLDTLKYAARMLEDVGSQIQFKAFDDDQGISQPGSSTGWGLRLFMMKPNSISFHRLHGSDSHD